MTKIILLNHECFAPQKLPAIMVYYHNSKNINFKFILTRNWKKKGQDSSS